MAINFFKKFKKQKDETNQKKLSATNEEQITLNRKIEEVDKENIKNQIISNITVSDDTPLRLLWNVCKSYGVTTTDFYPHEHIIDPVLETNELVNSKIESESAPVIVDENQSEVMKFISAVQGQCVKYTKELFCECIDKEIDEFMDGIDPVRFDNELSSCSTFVKLEDLKYSIEKSKRLNLKKTIDSKAVIKVSKDKLHAWICVFPPFNGGNDMSEEQLISLLNQNNIIYNVDRKVIEKICSGEYFKFFEIARGHEVVHGIDGYVEDRISRDNSIEIREDIHGNINYKELNNVKNIHVNDVICDIYYPVEGKDGKRIDGKIIAAKKGRSPKIPKGKNTILTEDGSQLIAAKDGEIRFHDNVFNISELLTIEHDVDNASGNIDFSGDVLIKGDVREGFSVKAEGNITIMGTVEAATVISAGNITINRGMTGGGRGTIKASGTLKCTYLENCKASANQKIEVDQVMYSEVLSNDVIYVAGKKGSVIGGKLVAGKGIVADVIGSTNNSCLKTEIVLGCTPHMLKKQVNINKSLSDTEEKLDSLEKNINYIESNIERATEERKGMLEKMKVQLKFTKLQKENLLKTLEKLNGEIEECTKSSSLKCKELNPMVIINVGEDSHTINRQLIDVHMYRKDNSNIIHSANLVENIEF